MAGRGGSKISTATAGQGVGHGKEREEQMERAKQKSEMDEKEEQMEEQSLGIQAYQFEQYRQVAGRFHATHQSHGRFYHAKAPPAAPLGRVN